jgi:hypothetical protein
MAAGSALRSLFVALLVVLAAFLAGCSRSPDPQRAGAPPAARQEPALPAGGGPPPANVVPTPEPVPATPQTTQLPASEPKTPPAKPAAPPAAKPADSAPQKQTSAPPSSAITHAAPPSPAVQAPSDRAAVPALPTFPWPPPRASAEYRINNRWVTSGDQTTLLQVADRIEAALSTAQYETWRYLAVPNGFALVTQIERIDLNGNPRQPRFGTQLPSLADMSFVEFLFALGKAPPGYYRVFVFVATDVPFNQSEERVDEKEAQRWMRAGLTQLPPDIGSMPYGPRYRTTALIYEFSKAAKKPAALVAPSKASASAHLQKARIWEGLSH